MSMSSSFVFDMCWTHTTVFVSVGFADISCRLPHAVESVDMQGVGESLAIWMCQAGKDSLLKNAQGFQMV